MVLPGVHDRRVRTDERRTTTSRSSQSFAIERSRAITDQRTIGQTRLDHFDERAQMHDDSVSVRIDRCGGCFTTQTSAGCLTSTGRRNNTGHRRKTEHRHVSVDGLDSRIRQHDRLVIDAH